LSTEATAYDTARNVSGDTYLDKLNHAISQIEDVKLRASGIVLNPRDWRKIQTTKEDVSGANTGNYLLGGPQGTARPFLWGLPVATTTAVSVGTFFVGAFATHTALFDRMEARIDVSTEHENFFVRNLTAIRAEERISLVVTRADSVVLGSF
jgi:HK97 family phage major capsid protein